MKCPACGYEIDERIAQLTEIQKGILELVSKAYTPKQIAAKVDCHCEYVYGTIRDIARKLNIKGEDKKVALAIFWFKYTSHCEVLKG